MTEVFAPTLPPEEQKEYVNSIFESHNSMETNPNVENYILNIMKKLYTEEVKQKKIIYIYIYMYYIIFYY